MHCLMFLLWGENHYLPSYCRDACKYIVIYTISKILKGGSDICEEAGIVVAGGHTIDSMEPIYGLVVTGLVDIKNLRKILLPASEID